MTFNVGTTVLIKNIHETTKVVKVYPIYESTQHVYLLNGYGDIIFPESELELHEISLIGTGAGLQVLMNQIIVTKENYLQVEENLKRIIADIKENMKTPPKYDDSSDSDLPPPKKVVKPKYNSDSDSEPRSAKKKVVKSKRSIANCNDDIPSKEYCDEIDKLVNTRCQNYETYIDVANLQHTSNKSSITKGIFTGPYSYTKQIEWFYDNIDEM